MEHIKVKILGIIELSEIVSYWSLRIGCFIIYYAENYELRNVTFIIKKNISRSILKYNAISDKDTI